MVERVPLIVDLTRSPIPCTPAYYDADSCSPYKLRLIKYMAEKVLPDVQGNPFQLVNTNNMMVWNKRAKLGGPVLKAELQIMLNSKFHSVQFKGPADSILR